MIFADTSLLCALYRGQDNSAQADRLVKNARGPLHVSSLVLFEFRQSARLQAFRFSKDRAQGFSRHQAQQMLAVLQTNVMAGGLVIALVDWPDVHSIAEQLSGRHTVGGGHRSLDVLHVATALHLQAAEFFTFDKNQALLARVEGLKVKPL